MERIDIESIVKDVVWDLLNPTVEIVTSNPVPEAASEYSAGYDLRADLWNVQEKFLTNAEVIRNGDNSIDCLRIHPGGHCLVPTGIYTAFPGMYRVEIVPRSGLSLKSRITITNSPGTIEGDYKNEWGVIIDNEGDTDFDIKHGDRICQAIFSLIVRPHFKQVEKVEDLSGTDRGGGFGHSGNN